MKSPTKTKDMTPSMQNKKMKQAVLPFKALSNRTPTQPLGQSPNHKRKLSATITDDAPAAKLNRKSVVKNVADDEDDVTIIDDLSTTECMEASVDLVISNVNKENQFVEPVAGSDGGNNLNETIDLDSENESGDNDDQKVADENDVGKSPNAKRQLDMDVDGTPEPRRSSRLSDDSFKIKLPMGKKAKETAKNAKKKKKAKSGGNKTDSGTDKSSENAEDVEEQEASDATEATKLVATSSTLSQASNQSISAKSNSLNTTFESPVRPNLNDSSTSMPMTPVQKLTPKQLLRKAESEKKMLEKQRAKEERDRKLQEAKDLRQREKDEKEEQKKREREEKEQKRLAELEEKKRRDEQKEEERRKREEEKRQREEEKERKRLAELEEKKRRDEQKEEERRKKEEEKRLKEEEKEQKRQAELEEKRQKEEEKRQKEEEKRQKEEAKKLAFSKFFFPKKTDANKKEIGESSDPNRVQIFMSFQVKEDMKMAPLTRRALLQDERKQLEEKVSTPGDADLNDLYLMELKQPNREIRKCGKTWVAEEEDHSGNVEDDEVQILDEFGTLELIEPPTVKKIYRAKFFKFDENRRPPYYGTWMKKSTLLGPRKPFAQDKALLDYDVNSDDEWEEEEPGESLLGTEDGSNIDPEDEYDIDNEFFVPHGHLSDEEMLDDDYKEDNSPETQKAKEKIAQKQFDDDWKMKTQKLKPKVIGLYWQNPDGSKPDNCKDDSKWDYLNARAGMYTVNSIILRCDVDDSDVEDAEHKGPKRIQITEDAVPDLIRLVHGNQSSCKFLIQEFQAFQARKNEKENPNRKPFSDQSIQNKIKELAQKVVCEQPGPMYNKKCWMVNQKKLREYNLTALSLPNTWTYTLKRKSEAEKERTSADDNDSDSKGGMSQALTAETVKEASAKNQPHNIARFVRPLNVDEKKKQFESITMRTASPINVPNDQPQPSTSGESKKKTSPRNKKSPSVGKTKKRVAVLMSVPRGEDFAPATKKAVMTDFFNQQAKRRKVSNDDPSNGDAASDNPANSSDDVIVLD